MIIAIGYNSQKPPKGVLKLLGGDSHIYQTTGCPVAGNVRFVSRNLKAFRDEKNGIKGFLTEPDIKWTDKGNYTIGEI